MIHVFIAVTRHFAFVDNDQWPDVVGCSSNNGGIWLFYGDGLGNWTPGVRPVTSNSYSRVAAQDIDSDSYLDIVATSTEFGGVQVLIGGEGTWEELSDFSLVLARYGSPDMATGFLGVLGPQRMSYGNAISTVNFVGGLLTNLVSETMREEE